MSKTFFEQISSTDNIPFDSTDPAMRVIFEAKRQKSPAVVENQRRWKWKNESDVYTHYSHWLKIAEKLEPSADQAIAGSPIMYVDLPAAGLTDEKAFDAAVQIIVDSYQNAITHGNKLIVHCSEDPELAGIYGFALVLLDDYNNIFDESNPHLTETKIKQTLAVLRHLQPGVVQTPEQYIAAIKLAKQAKALLKNEQIPHRPLYDHFNGILEEQKEFVANVNKETEDETKDKIDDILQKLDNDSLNSTKEQVYKHNEKIVQAVTSKNFKSIRYRLVAYLLKINEDTKSQIIFELISLLEKLNNNIDANTVKQLVIFLNKALTELKGASTTIPSAALLSPVKDDIKQLIAMIPPALSSEITDYFDLTDKLKSSLNPLQEELSFKNHAELNIKLAQINFILKDLERLRLKIKGLPRYSQLITDIISSLQPIKIDFTFFITPSTLPKETEGLNKSRDKLNNLIDRLEKFDIKAYIEKANNLFAEIKLTSKKSSAPVSNKPSNTFDSFAIKGKLNEFSDNLNKLWKLSTDLCVDLSNENYSAFNRKLIKFKTSLEVVITINDTIQTLLNGKVLTRMYNEGIAKSHQINMLRALREDLNFQIGIPDLAPIIEKKNKEQPKDFVFKLETDLIKSDKAEDDYDIKSETVNIRVKAPPLVSRPVQTPPSHTVPPIPSSNLNTIFVNKAKPRMIAPVQQASYWRNVASASLFGLGIVSSIGFLITVFIPPLWFFTIGLGGSAAFFFGAAIAVSNPPADIQSSYATIQQSTPKIEDPNKNKPGNSDIDNKKVQTVTPSPQNQTVVIENAPQLPLPTTERIYTNRIS